MAKVNFTVERVDPMDLDLDTAEQLASIDRASQQDTGLDLPEQGGPAKLTSLQLQSDCRPVDGLWLARRGSQVVGHVALELPWRDNTDTAHLRGTVHPTERRQGVGRELLESALVLVHGTGRSKVYTGSYEGSAGIRALRPLGFSSAGLGINAIRKLDVHHAPAAVWDELYDEARAAAQDYELTRMLGPTPDDMLGAMVSLHEAINDAPADDPDVEDDAWDADRVSAYDHAMAGRRQRVHRVIARHRASGEWAGLSMLCVDDFSPTTAFQEDTSVVRAHRGHRLGLLMKADMLRWVTEERPEVSAITTWNSTTNHHMIAVNERLGATVVARHVTFRMQD